MGVTDSKINSAETASADGITTVTDKTEEINVYLEKLKTLQIASPVLKSVPIENSLNNLLLRRPLSQTHAGEYGSLDPTTTASLLTLYQEWQRVTSEKINKNQEDLGNKIDVVEALAMKLLQRLNFTLCVMRTSAADLEDVHATKVELGEMKGKVKEVLQNYEALYKRIDAGGPEFLKATAKPFALNDISKRGLSCKEAAYGASSLS